MLLEFSFTLSLVNLSKSFSLSAYKCHRPDILLVSMVQVEGLSEDSKVRGVNLGGWLVIEGWIKPSLFDGIANGDMIVSYCTFCIFPFLCCVFGPSGNFLNS